MESDIPPKIPGVQQESPGGVKRSARNAQHYHEIMAPFVEHKIDYETWPVSRRIVRLQSRRLLEALARDNE